MALDIKPTRSELIKLKARIKQTKNGYKLLKMKRDGLFHEFRSLLSDMIEAKRDLPAVHIIHDDLVIATAAEDEHDVMIQAVMERIEEANLTLNPTKCLFKQKEIPFWGMIVCEEGVRPDPSKV